MFYPGGNADVGRPTRFRLPGIPQLITQRGHNRLPCFLDGADYAEFKQALWESAESAHSTIHAALMLPHAYWVLASPGEADSIGRMIQRTGRCYVRHCNVKYRREGTLWAGRYQACLVEPCEQAMQRCAAFLAATPAQAGFVASDTRWPWLFLEDGLDSAEAANLEDYSEISAILKTGLVFGSETFRHKIAADAGLRTEPGLRGRPPKDVKA